MIKLCHFFGSVLSTVTSFGAKNSEPTNEIDQDQLHIALSQYFIILTINDNENTMGSLQLLNFFS